jgi:hypothetical protein
VANVSEKEGRLEAERWVMVGLEGIGLVIDMYLQRSEIKRYPEM